MTFACGDKKRCGTCGEVKSIDAYSKNSSRKDGLNHRCKDCQKGVDKARCSHPSFAEKRRKYNQARKGKRAPAKPAERRLSSIRRAARILNLDWQNETSEYLKKTYKLFDAMVVYFGGKCLGCGKTENIELDHVIPLSIGGINHITNCQPLCRKCNLDKGTKIIDYRDTELLASFLDEHLSR